MSSNEQFDTHEYKQNKTTTKKKVPVCKKFKLAPMLLGIIEAYGKFIQFTYS